MPDTFDTNGSKVIRILDTGQVALGADVPHPWPRHDVLAEAGDVVTVEQAAEWGLVVVVDEPAPKPRKRSPRKRTHPPEDRAESPGEDR